MKKILALLVLVFAVFGFVGCEQDKGLVVSLASEPDTIDPALNSSVDGATYLVHLFEGLVAYRPDSNSDGVAELEAGVAKALPTKVDEGGGKVSYTFELRDGLKWSDGSDLTAVDFVYSWNRAVNPATKSDYQYMFDVIDGYADTADGKANAKLNVTSLENGKKLKVVLTTDVPYIMELFAFPTYFPVKKDVVEANPESWATKKETYVNNGPYKIEKFDSTGLVLVKNNLYHAKDDITMEKITFAFNADDNSLLANYKRGDYKFIDTVPNDEIKNLKKDYPNEFFITGQLGTYFVIFNVNDDTFKDFTEPEKEKIRKALSLLVDRNHIVEEIGQAGQEPAAGFVASGLTEPDGEEFVKRNGPLGDGAGYYKVGKNDYTANSTEAVKLLKEVATSSGKFTVGTDNKLVGFPKMEYATNPGTGHVAIASWLQAKFKSYGITMDVLPSQDWATFLNTRKAGDYSIARHGWLGDYNDPISFLDMWTSTSGNNDAQLGKDAHAAYNGYTRGTENNLTWAQSYDEIIKEVKASNVPTDRFRLMHEAETLLMSTGAITPIYFYTDIFMASTDIEGFFAIPLGYKFFMYSTLKEKTK